MIPDAAVEYILFQRTGYLRFPAAFVDRHLLRRLPFRLPFYNALVAVESRLGPERVKALYREDMRSEYLSIASVLPECCAAVLDIGCGVAGVDVWIDRHYRGQRPVFYLLDRSRVDRSVYYLFEQRAAFYNSLDVARATLVANGIDQRRIHLLEAGDGATVDLPAPVDLVISLLLWGFHYPVQTYCDIVHRRLSTQGVAVLDVRKGTDGLDVLRRRFGRVEVISESPKQSRVAAWK